MADPNNTGRFPQEMFYSPKSLDDAVMRYLGAPPHDADGKEYRSDAFVRACFELYGERAVQRAFWSHGVKIWGSDGLIGDAKPPIEISPGVFVTPETRITVERVLVFEGPASWVHSTTEKRWLRQGGPGLMNGPRLEPGKVAYERSFIVKIAETQDQDKQSLNVAEMKRALYDIADSENQSLEGQRLANIAKHALGIK